MKRLLSLFVTLALLFSTVPPVLAASSQEEALAQVASKVKQTISIPDGYDSFYGEQQSNGVNTYWRLEWSGAEGSLTVQADETGKIMYFARYTEGEYRPQAGYLPAFPATTREQAQIKAEQFLKQVLKSGLETASFEQARQQGSSSMSQHSFSGNILLNGLPSPFGFMITMNASDGQVVRFSRDDFYAQYLGGIPSVTAQASMDRAAQALKGTLSLRLEYVLQPDGKTAVLRYLPDPTDTYYFDDATGQLVNLTELMEDIEDRGYAGGVNDLSAPIPEASQASASANLSSVEQAGIEKLEGVLSKDTLDAEVKSNQYLGLSSYTLSQANYSVDRETSVVSCRLQYVRQDGERTLRRYVTVNAKTGLLTFISSGALYDKDRKATVDEKAAQATAGAFLQNLMPSEFAKCDLYSKEGRIESGYYTFLFTETKNGYFFPENFLSVQVDVSDGSISGFSQSFQTGITFENTQGLISSQAALDTWFSTYHTPVSYQAVPEKLDLSMPEAQPLIELGQKYCYTLKLGYALTQDGYYLGIDAKSGAPVQAATERTSLAYDDLNGLAERDQIEALAAYGIGYLEGSFQPQKALTQYDLLLLLISAAGYQYNETDPGASDQVYSIAYQLGLLERRARNDNQRLTRSEMLKLILDGSGYGAAAQLPNIYQCSFTDAHEIFPSLYGYCAIAQALGLAVGDDQGRFYPNQSATRVDAAVMLYRFMSRSGK